MRLKYLEFLFKLEICFCRQQILNLAAYGIIFYAAAISSFFIQKADGLCHPLLKLSLLNFVKLRLEGEVQFGEDGIGVFAAFSSKVPPINSVRIRTVYRFRVNVHFCTVNRIAYICVR